MNQQENFWKSIKSSDKIFWTGIVIDDRISGLDKVKTYIDNYGFIVDYHFFSDISASLTIEIEERKVGNLFNALKQIIRIDDYSDYVSDSDRERTIFLNLTFTKGTGDLKVEVPAVPG